MVDVEDRPRPAWCEAERLAALGRYRILDTDPEPAFDDIVRLAAAACDAPVAAVGFIADQRQWFKAEQGVGAREVSLDVSVCAQVLLRPGLTVIPDLWADERFNRNPALASGSGPRFYAGIVLATEDGFPIGTLCVSDHDPRPDGLTELQAFTMRALGRQVMAQLELRLNLAARRDSEARLARLLATTPSPIVELGAGGRVTYANEAAERALGAGAGSLVGRSFDDPAWQVEADGRPVPPGETAGGRALRGETVAGFAHTLVAADGRRVAVLAGAVPVRDEHGRVTGALAAFQDVTARHAAAAALRESEERFRSVAEALPGLTWIAGARGRIEYASRQWRDYTGLSADAMPTGGWIRFLHPADVARTRRSWAAAVAAGRLYEGEVRLRSHDGAFRWWLARALPIRDAGGAVARWVGVCTDIDELVRARASLAASREHLERRIDERTADLAAANLRLEEEATERELTEAALRQAQKMEAVGQLTGGIAHDFNNMLQGIGGSLELVRRRVEQGRMEEAASYVEVARKAVERAAGLTHRLLAFARRQALAPSHLAPCELVHGMEDLIRRTVGPGVRVDLRLDTGGRTVLCDANQLESALLNLVVNARDAMPSGGVLTIATAVRHLGAADLAGQDGSSPGDYVEIAVADTGAGMTPDVMAQAFEPFFTTKPLGQGTGLGLSQIYGFVRQSGGLVRLESRPGQGTAVRLLLPRANGARAGEAAEAPGPERSGAAGTVLVVEDEGAIRALVAEELREQGHRVLEAADGTEALRLLRSAGQIDLLVTDVGLPGLNGRQLADAARERQPGLPVLFITGYAGLCLDGQLAPGMEVIAKPFTLGALAARVRSLIGGRNAGGAPGVAAAHQESHDV